jgi:hypothetical protein
MKSTFTFFLCIIAFASGINSIQAQSWDLKQKLGSNDQEPADNLGISVAISDSFMVAGAWWEEGEDGTNAPINSSGAAYIYRLGTNGEWTEVQKLVSPDREVLGYFGFYVAIDGGFILVGAFNEDHGGIGNAGVVYAYHLSPNDEWVLDDSLMVNNPGNNANFGRNLSLGGSYALIGADNEDTDATGGNSLTDAGAAYLFKRQPDNTYVQISKLVPADREAGDHFGKYVDIDETGVVIGAFKKGGGLGLLESGVAYAAYCAACNFDNLNSSVLRKIVPGDQNSFEAFGWDVAISGQWVLIGKSSESDQPGGGTGSNTGAAYFYHWENNQWVEKQKVYASDVSTGAHFGRAVAMDGPVAVIGAGNEWEDANGQNPVNGAGAAYVFELQGNNQWMAVEKVTGTNRGINDLFGEDAVDVSGSQVVVGAWLQDTITNVEVIDGGAIYIFQRNFPVSVADPLEKNDLVTIINNPSVDGLLRIRYLDQSSSLSSDWLRIFSLDGQLLFQQERNIREDWPINMSGLAPGMYLVQVSRKGEVPQTLKWIRL